VHNAVLVQVLNSFHQLHDDTVFGGVVPLISRIGDNVFQVHITGILKHGVDSVARLVVVVVDELDNIVVLWKMLENVNFPESSVNFEFVITPGYFDNDVTTRVIIYETLAREHSCGTTLSKSGTGVIAVVLEELALVALEEAVNLALRRALTDHHDLGGVIGRKAASVRRLT